MFRAVILCLSLAIALAEVTVLSGVQTLYSRSPKLRIKGTGFDADEHHIFMDLSANGQDSLKLDKDYMITKDDEGLILKLLSSRKWVDLDNRKPPVALVLRSVRLNSIDSDNLLPEPVILANVLRTPSVNDNDVILYSSASNELRINGSGLEGAKKVDLYFDPPIYKEVGYEVVSKFPLVKNEIVLRLRYGYTWRDEPGPLYVVGIDTGGGPVKTQGADGVRVAEVQADLDAHGVTVEDTYDEQVIYHDAPSIFIRGDGFNVAGTTFRFANGLLGKGVNYTTTQLTESGATLRLTPGSHWRKNVENLPAFLSLLAVNAGEGFVAVGPTNAKKGRDIARVFEKPIVYSGNTKLFKTHSHELHIYGEGFPRQMAKPKLLFSPELKEGRDYEIYVMDRTEMIVTLKDGRKWSDEKGPLLLTKINTRGDMDGWVDLPGDGVHVAEIIDDLEAEQTGGISINPSSNRIYQSMLQDSFTITGSGFVSKMSLTFDPPIKESIDYDMDIISSTEIRLRLRRSKKWSPDAGALIVKSCVVDFKTYPLANGDGIRVAVVLADPVIDGGKDTFHETQSKVIAVYGHGFTNAADIKIELQPTRPESYKILGVTEDTIRIQLKEGYDWLPAHLNLDDAPDDSRIPLQVLSIDTGAGRISFDNVPVAIGFIVKDREGVICDDSCEFAFDGVCDDGTNMESYYYYEYGEEYYMYDGFYEDDDLGGYYNDEERAGDFYYADGELIDDDYYMETDEYQVSACVEGTDCTDCGGVDAIIDWSEAALDPENDLNTCSNTCIYARDGVCDDPRGANYCKIGTDCQDCGPVGQDNFTKADDDGWWDDDDDYWAFNDGNFLDQIKGPVVNSHKIKRTRPPVESAGPAAMFLTVLEGMVYTIGSIFAAIGCYLVYRWYQGYSLPFMNVFSPENMSPSRNTSMSQREFDMAPTKRMPITPDVIRT
eukprot:TRINITY_DN63986_c0_g1_i1.p1 TRINITY_DN63986_c0_g1~~TRINITY_DN63986_c0_g1_i1.p1  ORF type:complete len:941 (+),score=55.61 TRINITY_DN63986_c0_g1_i1:73-2895(+)